MPFDDEIAPVAVVAHRPCWAREFAGHAARLRELLGALAVAVDHVGSTSVPGLAAKDCLDIQVRTAPLDEECAGRATARLTAAGFRLRPEPWNRTEVVSGRPCRKLVFAPPVGARRCNIHLREHGGPNARFALLFRDHLRADAEVRRAWGTFKQRLAAEVPDLAAYGRIKQPATEALMRGAERWAAATGWQPS
ncbi:GrpB family protein [Streptomyces catenulae]|uniref:GrpB family protein n=1 Tax=Streptomyces catenulae TaxID=66875 RepID=A0ABV2Z839_9ACTN|nr:GrpB family protein [Streptomyces catenulae]